MQASLASANGSRNTQHEDPSERKGAEFPQKGQPLEANQWTKGSAMFYL